MNLFNVILRGYRPSKARSQYYPKSTYRNGKYTVTKHAVNQMCSRKINTGQLHYNLHSKVMKSSIGYDEKNRPSYKRVSKNNIVAAVNPANKNVTSVWRVGSKRIKAYERKFKNGKIKR